MNNQESVDLSKQIKHNNIINYCFMAVNAVLGLFATKIYISYLGNALYGVWITIMSISSWSNYGDLGIGNGLRNRIATLFAKNDKNEMRNSISYSIRKISLISLVIFAILTVVSELLFLLNIFDKTYRIALYITNLSFCICLILNLSKSISYGIQKSWVAPFSQMLSTIIKIVVIITINLVSSSGLIKFSIICGLSDIIPSALILLYLVNSFHVPIFVKNSGKHQDDDFIKNMGIKFFILQISCAVLYSTDSIIINKVLSSELVTKYSIITNIYETGNSLFSVLLISLWSAVTYALAKNDIKWIKKETKHLLRLWFLYSIGVVVVSFALNFIVKIWLHNDLIVYESSIIILFAVYTILDAFGAIFVNISNGMSRLKIQLIGSVIAIFVNIPLSVLFATKFGMGIFGVKLATFICKIGAFFIVPIDVIRILSRMERNNKNA